MRYDDDDATALILVLSTKIALDANNILTTVNKNSIAQKTKRQQSVGCIISVLMVTHVYHVHDALHYI